MPGHNVGESQTELWQLALANGGGRDKGLAGAMLEVAVCQDIQGGMLDVLGADQER